MSDWISRDAVLQALQEWTYCCDAENVVRALPAVQPGHVNETPKSEHDAANMLTLTAERDRYRKALEDIIADCEADYPPSHGAIKYAAKLALKGESHD